LWQIKITGGFVFPQTTSYDFLEKNKQTMKRMEGRDEEMKKI
jgi:hypothetical protein